MICRHEIRGRIRTAGRRGVCLILLALLLVIGKRASAQDLVPITVQLDWKPGVQFAGLLIAQERGWYQDAGLAVTIRANDFQRPCVDVVAEDDHTVGTSEARALVEARGRGLPVRAVATMFQSSPVVLISLESSGLRNVGDFAGKTIGIHRPEDVGMLHAVFGQIQVTPRRVGFDFKELLAGEVVAAPGYLMDEPLRLAQNGTRVNLLPLSEHGWTDYAQVLFVNERFLRNDPATLEKFLAATFRGWREVLADPDAAAEFIGRRYPAGLNPSSLREALRRLAPLLTSESPHPGTMKPETWRRIIDLASGDERAARPLKVSDVADFSYMSALEKD